MNWGKTVYFMFSILAVVTIISNFWSVFKKVGPAKFPKTLENLGTLFYLIISTVFSNVE